MASSETFCFSFFPQEYCYKSLTREHPHHASGGAQESIFQCSPQDKPLWNRGGQRFDVEGMGTRWGVHQACHLEECAGQDTEAEIQVRETDVGMRNIL